MMTVPSYRFALVMAVALGSASLVHALDICVRSDRDQVQAGEEVGVAVEVRNVQSRPRIEPPRMPDCTVRQVGSERATPTLLRGVAVKGGPFHVGAADSPPGQGLVNALRQATLNL